MNNTKRKSKKKRKIDGEDPDEDNEIYYDAPETEEEAAILLAKENQELQKYFKDYVNDIQKLKTDLRQCKESKVTDKSATPLVDERFAKYDKMRKMNLPEGAIRQKMTQDGFTPSDIELFFSSTSTASPTPSLSEDTDIKKSIPMIPKQPEKPLIPEGSFWKTEEKILFSPSKKKESKLKIEKLEIKEEKKQSIGISKFQKDIETFIRGQIKSLNNKLNLNKNDYTELYNKIYTIILDFDNKIIDSMDKDVKTTIKDNIIPNIKSFLLRRQSEKEIISSIMSKNNDLTPVDIFIKFFFDENKKILNCIEVNEISTSFTGLYELINKKFDKRLNAYKEILENGDNKKNIAKLISAIKSFYDRNRKSPPEFYPFDIINKTILVSENKEFIKNFYQAIKELPDEENFAYFKSDKFYNMIDTVAKLDKIETEITIANWKDFKTLYSSYKNNKNIIIKNVMSFDNSIYKLEYDKYKIDIENTFKEYENKYNQLSDKEQKLVKDSKDLTKYFGEKYTEKGDIDDIIINTIISICKQYLAEKNKYPDSGYKRKHKSKKRSRRRSKSRMRNKSKSRKLYIARRRSKLIKRDKSKSRKLYIARRRSKLIKRDKSKSRKLYIARRRSKLIKRDKSKSRRRSKRIKSRR